MRGTKTLINFQTSTFECNQELFYIVVFSSIGGGAMLIAVAIGVICFLVKRRRKGKLDIQAKEEENIDLIESDKKEIAFNPDDALSPEDYYQHVRSNYLKGSPSRTLVDVEFENPNFLIDPEYIDKKKEKEISKKLERKLSKKKKSEKAKQAAKKKQPVSKAKAAHKEVLDIKKLKHYAHLYESLQAEKAKKTKSGTDQWKKDKEKLTKMIKDMDKEYKKIMEKKKHSKKQSSSHHSRDRKRRTKSNRDVVRLMSRKESRSMPDVINYINSLPRTRSPERDRHRRMPIYHIDHADPESSSRWVRSMVDIPRAHRSGHIVDRFGISKHRSHGPRNPHYRLDDERRFYGIPDGYHTVSSGRRAYMVDSRLTGRSRSLGHGLESDGMVSRDRWAQDRHMIRDERAVPSNRIYDEPIKVRPRGTTNGSPIRSGSPTQYADNRLIPNGHVVRDNETQTPRKTVIKVEETTPKSPLTVVEEDNGNKITPSRYNTIASTQGVGLSNGITTEKFKPQRRVLARSASVDGHLSQWV